MHGRHVHQRLSCGRSIQSLDATVQPSQRAISAALILLGLLLSAPGFLYLVALWGIDGRPVPVDDASVVEKLAIAGWRACGERGPITIKPDNPWAIAGRLLTNEYPDDSPGRRASWAIARNYNNEHLSSYASWHPSGVALTIWISRHWTARQIAATVHRDGLCDW